MPISGQSDLPQRPPFKPKSAPFQPLTRTLQRSTRIPHRLVVNRVGSASSAVFSVAIQSLQPPHRYLAIESTVSVEAISMTVRSIVQMFESMAASTGADAPAHQLESPERGNVHGLVTYYDALAEVEETPIILPTKTVRLVRAQPAMSASERQQKDVELEEQVEHEQEEQGQDEQEQAEEELQEGKMQEQEPSNQEMSEVPAAPVSSPPRLVRDCSVPMSKIPQPKSREFHLAACSVRTPALEGAPRSFMFSPSSNDLSQPVYVPPPTPISARLRAPCTSYAAFVARIENSSSRLLDFEKDERWLGQIETMKGRVEALKQRNQMALAREVASTPRKSRSMSECSGVSTASTASMSSMDTPEISCQ